MIAFRHVPVRYAFSVVTVAAAFELKKLLEPVTGTGAPFVLFFAAVAVTSLLAGPWPGACAAVLSLPLGAYIVVVRSGYAPSQAGFQAALFAIDCLVVVSLSFLVTRARRAAESTGERLRLANEAGAIASWDLDVATRRLRWSPDTGVFPGLRAGAPADLALWLSLVHPDDRDAFESAYERSLAPGGHGAMLFESRVVRPDGVVRWFSWVGRTTYQDRAGGRAPVRQVGTAIDITERRQREEALKELTAEVSRSEARLRDLIELAPDAFLLADLDGRFTDVNQAACRMLGYARDELVGKTILDIIPPEEAPRLAAVKAALLVPGRVNRAETTHRRKDGTLVPVEVSSNILPDGRWQAFARDISARKRDIADRERIEKEQRLLAEAGAVLASSLDYEQTLATVGELVVRDVADWCIVDLVDEDDRPTRLKVVSADPGQAPLAAQLERLPLDRRRPHLVLKVLETRRPLLMERVTAADLESFAQNAEHLQILRAIAPRSAMGLPLLIRGQLLGVLVFISSTPSRVYRPGDLRLAEALAERAALAIENGRLYQAAVEATRLRDEVLGVVAHDLRNPLAAIQMQTSALKRKGSEPERRNPKPRESILRAATRMNRLIDDLLDVSLIEAGQLGLERSRVSTRQLVADSVEAQRPLASSASLEVRLELANELPDVWGDQHRLNQVLANLVGNAIKFTPRGGRITVGAASRGSEVLFWVADTGCGISADGLPRVFDRFWQERKGTRRGAGLGLPITRGIVETHGGRIWVESTQGRGSIFFFTIPEATPVEAPSPEATQSPNG